MLCYKDYTEVYNNMLINCRDKALNHYNLSELKNYYNTACFFRGEEEIKKSIKNE